MGIFSKFLSKHANEMRAIGRALDVLQYSGALNPQARAQIDKTVSAVETAAKNIEASIAGPNAVDLDKQALKEAVQEALPDLVAVAVAQAVAKALAKKPVK